MGLESWLRDVVVRTPLAESRAIGNLYATLNRIRYARSWDRPVEFRGARFCIGEDLSIYPFVRAGGFEQREFDWLLPRVRRSDVVWDVGANVGIYTVLMAKRADRVVAFEPVPATVERLQHNIALNGVSNVVVVQAALSDSPGRAAMATLPASAGGNKMVRNGGSGTVEVDVRTGDDFWRAEGVTPDVIKVDIEGFEPEFVRGALDLISERRPLMTLEVNLTAMGNAAGRANWQSAIDELFRIYGDAMWFGPTGMPTTVTELHPEGLPRRPCTLAFGDR